MGKVALADFVNKALLFALLVLAVFLKGNFLWILFAHTVSNAVYFIIVFTYAKKITKIRFIFQKEKWFFIISRSWPIAFSIALNLIYFKADTILLSLFRTQEEVGLYGAPYKIFEVLINIAYLFLGLLLPIMTAAYAQKKYLEFKNIIQYGLDTMLALGIPLIFGTFFIGKNVMVLIAGKEYETSGDILKILIAAVLIIFLASVFGYGIVSINKQKEMLLFYGINALVSLLAYLYFIPRYSFWGAAWVTVYSEFFILIASLFILYKNTQFIPSIKMLYKSCAASLVMSAALILVSHFPVVIVLPIAVMTYGISLYFFGGVSKQTLSNMVKIRQ